MSKKFVLISDTKLTYQTPTGKPASGGYLGVLRTYEDAVAEGRRLAAGATTPYVVVEVLTVIKRDTPPVVVEEFVAPKI